MNPQNKYTYEFVKQKFEEAGLELVSTEYKDSRAPLEYICPKHREKGVRRNNFYNFFRRGDRCMFCSMQEFAETQRTDINIVKQAFIDAGYTPLFNEYKKMRQKLKYLCPVHGEQRITYELIKKGGKCRLCVIEQMRSDIDDVKKVFLERGYLPVFEDYKNAHTPLEYICSKHEDKGVLKIALTDLKKGTGCKWCAIERMSGENSPNYNHDLTEEERQQGRKFLEYYEWRKSVYERDNYTCQRCGQKSGDINAHHIFNYSSNPELRTELSNGITFCLTCHIEFHKRYTKFDNNLQQIKEFINDYNKEKNNEVFNNKSLSSSLESGLCRCV